jgi:hypothetical protein
VDLCSGTEINLASYFDDKLDIHHIFPRDWCDKFAIPAFQRDCIINKTAISARTNRSIGGRAPSEYLRTLRKNGGYDEPRQREILGTHHIDLDSVANDNFKDFLLRREEALLRLIEAVTDKTISRSVRPATVEVNDGEDDEDENS